MIQQEDIGKMRYSVCHERGTKKNAESPTGIEPMAPSKTDFARPESPSSSVV